MTKNTFTITVIRQYQKGNLLAGMMYLMTPQGTFLWSAISIENNARKIPAGIYPLSIYASPKFKRNVLLFSKVPKRSFIEIHIANKPEELEGCIAPNLRLDLPTLRGVSSSLTFNQLMLLAERILKDKNNELICNVIEIPLITLF